jgi:uncharacterized protein (DUF488 family)
MTPNGGNTIFTVGHSDHSIQRFSDLLVRNSISAIADVRSMPYSRFTPQFNREQLKAALRTACIRYVFLGDELGARRSEPECYVEGKARYELIARTPRFHEGLQRLQEGSQSYRVALLCAEKDPITCHRAILVCRHLRPLGMSIAHIMDDGRTETNAEMEERLLKVTGLDQDELFGGKADAIERAYDIQGDRIAYAMNGVTADERGEL